jgi:hypothetical protein
VNLPLVLPVNIINQDELVERFKTYGHSFAWGGVDIEIIAKLVAQRDVEPDEIVPLKNSYAETKRKIPSAKIQICTFVWVYTKKPFCYIGNRWKSPLDGLALVDASELTLCEDMPLHSI